MKILCEQWEARIKTRNKKDKERNQDVQLDFEFVLRDENEQ